VSPTKQRAPEQLVSIEIPKQARQTKSRFDDKLLAQAAERLANGDRINLHGGQSYEKRSDCQLAAFYARQEVARYMDVEPRQIRSRTFTTDTGHSYAIFLRADEADDADDES
jgi:hypothetical protein